MSAIYEAKDGDMVDWVCWAHYGHQGALEAVYDANPGLAEKGLRLSAGDTFVLPDLPDQKKAEQPVRLWS